VHLKHVAAHQRHLSEKKADDVDSKNSISRAVDHDTEGERIVSTDRLSEKRTGEPREEEWENAPNRLEQALLFAPQLISHLPTPLDLSFACLTPRVVPVRIFNIDRHRLSFSSLLPVLIHCAGGSRGVCRKIRCSGGRRGREGCQSATDGEDVSESSESC
jgi:hypothetical protein